MSLFPMEGLKRSAEFPQPARWHFAEIAGRFVEISGSRATSALTLACGLVIQAQRQGEPVGWITPRDHSFYPPDAAEGGVDLDALVVVQLPDAKAVPRAGERLLRSGAFGLVVLDIGAAGIPTPHQARLAALAQQHHAALVFLTEKESGEMSLGSLVSLRVQAGRRQVSGGRFVCGIRALKDKRRGPAWTQEEACSGPAGLR